VSAEGGALFRNLLEVLKAPALATQMGIGTVPSDSPFFIGHGGIIGGDAGAFSVSGQDRFSASCSAFPALQTMHSI